MLVVQHLDAYYHDTQVLHQIHCTLAPGQVLTVLGRNGAGRSSFAKALVGLVASKGSIQWHGQEMIYLASHQRAHLGLAYVPENRDVFPTLTVLQNLVLGQLPPKKFWISIFPWSQPNKQNPSERYFLSQAFTLEDVWKLFPALEKRQKLSAGNLSGGEQQMLSIARALLRQPSLLIVDEPTEGLAPQVVQQIHHAIKHYLSKGGAVVWIEQKMHLSWALSEPILVLGQGSVQWSGTREQFLENPKIQAQWLELSFPSSFGS